MSGIMQFGGCHCKIANSRKMLYIWFWQDYWKILLMKNNILTAISWYFILLIWS